MTTSSHTSDSGFTLGRRSLLIGGSTAAAMSMLALPHTAGAAGINGEPDPTVDFDLDTDNYIRWARPSTNEQATIPSVNAFVGSMDATLILWMAHVGALAAFDAVAPYHETAVGTHARIPRRPSSESATNRNMNIALFHSQYRIFEKMPLGGLEGPLGGLRDTMVALGLDPDDASENLTSPVGIANVAAKAVWNALKNDGMNVLGYEGGRKYHPLPWSDYTGYRPVNTPFELRNPSRWQPQLQAHRGRRVGGGHGDLGIYVAQHFVTPQAAVTQPHIYSDPARFRLAPPTFSDHRRTRAYKQAVDEILEASATLTDERKALAEVMDNKSWGLGYSATAAAQNYEKNHGEMGVFDWVAWSLQHSLATFGAMVAAWHQKRRYDAVRPISAVRHVYGRSKITAWGGPGRGTVTDLPANEWVGYLPVGDHPEYPSGSTTMCAAGSQAMRRYCDSEEVNWTLEFKAHKSLTEPGIVPARDLKVHFTTWSELNKACAESRVWGGVHFRETVERSMVFGEQFGDLAHEHVQRHITGNVKDRAGN
ncbi:hypothetical protein O7599_04790 [Streptomyces sp. WMMC500]|uniref:DUF6851 domain-containing protein n=1 Tax=Streptomyces sp. WMMC500 TaxID=3015154 RepID=UPI00248CEBCA|nr:hypothetical protein [Streptomyces sp. WMMC500]WBB61872.1 hypothetical protein O7599_04790 [Streptomyces sp. WMMC500]